MWELATCSALGASSWAVYTMGTPPGTGDTRSKCLGGDPKHSQGLFTFCCSCFHMMRSLWQSSLVAPERLQGGQILQQICVMIRAFVTWLSFILERILSPQCWRKSALGICFTACKCSEIFHEVLIRGR